MMSAEQNERITRVGPGTPAGKLLRQYWQPAALTEELSPERPVVTVRLLGEDLVLFRDNQGRYGLLDRRCPHRGTDLAFGRCEDGGLRCVFHGWLFDVSGQCLQTPAEPPSSRMHTQIRQKSYPAIERNGIVFAYMGEGEPPALPDFDCFVAPDRYTFAFKGLWECNWLQAQEVGVDPSHASFLHRYFEDEDLNNTYGRPFRDASVDSDLPQSKLLREYDQPQINVVPADTGFKLITLRPMNATQTHVRVTNMVFPNIVNLPMSQDMVLTQYHVPVDDHSCYWYSMFTAFQQPVDKQELRNQRLGAIDLPSYRSKFNKSNNYGFKVSEQKHETYTGMGYDINVHDQFAVESQGPISDRTREHLGQSDRAISAYRRMLLDAIAKVENGERAPMVFDAEQAKRITGPATIDGVGPADGWDQYWQDAYRKRRAAAVWNDISTAAE
ncbi:MAG TPA: aromatic ring-hydroxylating dioxygenase subunit alpha [Xanthobacteraceae bacterium]|nr:aromatic ring-hydroxylating dioxygenase subunit alpha [Xanthobacteraceae bacterium]